MYIITIDTGTTNTRVCLWNGFTFIGHTKRPVGVRDSSIDGNNHKIIRGISESIAELLSIHDINEIDIGLVLASGMISSNLGLTEVTHLIAPAKITDFANHLHVQTIPEVCSLPIHFIPGLKNSANLKNGPIEARDVMRGEEVETLGLLDLTKLNKAVTFILPGSHTKFVAVNNKQELTGCCTTLAGELTSVITHNTILTNSLHDSFTDDLDREFLHNGALSCKTVGFTRSLFSIRVLSQTTNASQNQLASFLLGIITIEDINALINSESLERQNNHQIGIYGFSIVGQAFEFLLNKFHPSIQTFKIDENISKNLSGHGSLLIARSANLF